ncbi:predicted protein [Streptomyces sp. AA4]|nr:hypothetical protein [Streptomyces sp. AA4]EFL07517.1 predicted protein [Streptomyces sp. AA4]
MQPRRDPVALVVQRGVLAFGPRLRQFERDRRLVGEPGRDLQVVGGERRAPGQPGDGQHPGHRAVPGERNQHHRIEIEAQHGRHGQPRQLVRPRPDPRLAAGEHRAGHSGLGEQFPAGQLFRARPDRAFDEKVALPFRRAGHRDQVGGRELAGVVHDAAERVAEIRRQQLPGDRRRRAQPFLLVPRGLVQPRVLDRAARRRGERQRQLLVLLAEPAPRGVGEIEVAEHLAAHPDRDAQEARHRRMPLGEPGRAGIVLQPVQPHRARVLDDRAEQALALGQPADPLDRLRVRPGVHEFRQPPVRPDHAQRRVPRFDQLARGLHEAAQQRGQGEASGEGLGRAQQPAQPALRADDLLGAFHQLAEKLVQFHPRLIGERQPRWFGCVPLVHPGSCPSGPRVPSAARHWEFSLPARASGRQAREKGAAAVFGAARENGCAGPARGKEIGR